MSAENGLQTNEDGVIRCWWPGTLPDYVAYHDDEWGNPVDDDKRLFEKLCLEGFQSGLSWLTILRKRENFRLAFHGFDFHLLAQEDEAVAIEKHLQDAGIVRHKGKIASVYNNARRAVELQKEYGSLSRFFWSFEPDEQERPAQLTYEVARTLGKTETSTKISKELKKRGWSFVGPTTVYAFMQAMGMVNDHLEGCACRNPLEARRAAFTRPD